MNKTTKGFYDLAFDYHIAAVTLHTQLIEASYLFYPVAFLLRHTIELLLKGIIIQKEQLINPKQQISEMKIGKNLIRINRTHSLQTLWEHYLTIENVDLVLNKKSQIQISTILKKINEIDFSSTKYRYPLDKDNNPENIEPLKVDDSGIAPEIGSEPPIVAIKQDKVITITEGNDLLLFNMDIFDVAEILFSLFEKYETCV